MNSDASRIRPPQVAAAATVVASLEANEDVAASLNMIVSRLRDVLGADGVTVELEHERSLVTCYASGHARRWLGRRSPLIASLGGICFSRGEATMSGDVQKDRRFSDLSGTEPEVRSMISVPIQLNGMPVGLVRILSGTRAFFSGRDLVVARLVGSSIRRVLMHELRESPDAGAPHTLQVIEALWSLRDRRRSQKRLAGEEGYEVSMVTLNITGYLTSEILGHVSMLVRSSDHCLREDAGTYSIVMPGTTAEEAEIAGARIRRELEVFAVAADDDIHVSYEVRTLLPAHEAKTA